MKKADLLRIQRNGSTWKTEVVASLDSPGPLTLDPSGNLLFPWTTKGWGEIRFDDLVRWKQGTVLARGGFANVWDGYDRQRRQRCAVKIFRSEVNDAKDRAWIEHRFEQEVAALERIQHPNVVSIYAHRPGPSRTEAAVLVDCSIAIVKDANKTFYGVSRAGGRGWFHRRDHW